MEALFPVLRLWKTKKKKPRFAGLFCCGKGAQQVKIFETHLMSFKKSISDVCLWGKMQLPDVHDRCIPFITLKGTGREPQGGAGRITGSLR